jgi:hypothetical protein
MNWTTVVKLTGITSGICMGIAVILVFFKIKIKNRVKIHKAFGIAAVAAGLIHALLIFYMLYS